MLKTFYLSLHQEKKENIMKWSFNIYVNDVRDVHYEFDTKEKAETWQKNYISDMKKIGCWPIPGVKTRVEEN